MATPVNTNLKPIIEFSADFTVTEGDVKVFVESAGGGGGTGDVVGPSSAIDSNFAAFDTTTGKLIKDSGKKASDFDAAGAAATAETNAKSYADGLVVGLWDDRGSFDASGGAYPSSGGSGAAGAIVKGDVWTISVAGTLPTGQVVEVGDIVRALVNTPGNTQANWAITQNNIGYTAENTANKDTDATMAANSDTKYPSQKAVKTALALKADLASPTFTGTPAAPTPALGTNTTQLATMAAVQQELANAATIANAAAKLYLFNAY